MKMAKLTIIFYPFTTLVHVTYLMTNQYHLKYNF